MNTISPEAAGLTADHLASTTSRSRWPLLGTVAGLTGFVATLITDLHPDIGTKASTPDVVDQLSRTTAHISLVAGYVTVALLVVLAATWRRLVEPRVASSTAARVVSNGLLISAAALTLGYGWKGAMAVYLPGGLNGKTGGFDREGLYVMYVLNDFGSFIGWLGVTIAAGAIAWMSLRERTISRWIGVVSLVPVLAVTAFAVGTGLPGFPGVVSPLFMVIAFTGLAFGKSTITR
jgi:hypothetical protein